MLQETVGKYFLAVADYAWRPKKTPVLHIMYENWHLIIV